MQYSLYSLILFFVSIGIFSLFFYSLFQKKNRLSGSFSLLCLVMGIYTFFYSLELMFTDYEKVVFFLKLEYFGVAFIPPLWFILSYKFYTKKSIELRYILLVFLIPSFTLAAAFTNDYLHLLYKKIELILYEGLYVVKLEKGVSYIISTIYSYSLLLTGQFLFFRAWIEGEGLRKKQAALFFAVSLIPMFASFIYLLGLTPGKVDPMPLSYALLSFFYYVAVFKYGFLEMKEIIREISFEQIVEGIIVVDNYDRLIDFNTSAQKTFSFLNQNNLGRNLMELSNSIFKSDYFCFDINEKNRYYEVRKTSIEEGGKTSGNLYILEDITEKKYMMDRLEFNAKYDFLTEVYNRHELFELSNIEVYRAKRHKSSLCFLLFDIDFFKKVNDTYGHLAGDLVIKSIAKAIKSRIRKTDIIGRYGGEEFMLVLSETNLEQSKVIAENLRKLVEDLDIFYNNIRIKVTISIGIAEFQGNMELQDIISFADEALYRAKNSGRNKVEVI